MEKVVIASGKGGVGKSMLASSWAYLASQEFSPLVVDADVDAPNFHLWCKKDLSWQEEEEVALSKVAKVNRKKCTGCGQCAENCVFGAIEMIADKAKINPLFCEGCGACQLACPHGAINIKEVINGKIRRGRINNSLGQFTLLGSQLKVGQKGSGKLVDYLAKKAREIEYDLLLVDAPAGLGCPIVATLKMVDKVILITEPTLSAYSDLKRILSLVNYFNLPFWLVINKQDVNLDRTKKLAEVFPGKILGKINYSSRVFEALNNFYPPVLLKNAIADQLKQSFKQFRQQVIE